MNGQLSLVDYVLQIICLSESLFMVNFIGNTTAITQTLSAMMVFFYE
jgi:hypothetical protein